MQLSDERGNVGQGTGRRKRLCDTYKPENDPAARAVVALVARERGVPPKLLLHPSRCRAEVAASRQLAMYLMHVGLGRSLGQVGCFFGRDRSTVSYACALVEDRRDEAAFDRAICGLEETIAALRENGEREGARD